MRPIQHVVDTYRPQPATLAQRYRDFRRSGHSAASAMRLARAEHVGYQRGLITAIVPDDCPDLSWCDDPASIQSVTGHILATVDDDTDRAIEVRHPRAMTAVWGVCDADHDYTRDLYAEHVDELLHAEAEDARMEHEAGRYMAL